ncbi:cupredoxin domain-containing protein [Paenibacillus sp. RC84]|uniref:cupredoxin domain-containing protein n=1 Tax=Paenibacillus sp. RC84 TaxID=3156252 RepID=UPI003510D430
MFKSFVLKKYHFVMFLGFLCVAFAAVLFLRNPQILSTAAEPATASERTIQLVTGEFSTKLDNGKEIEAYRWDPGTIVVRKGENIRLSIYGVNGASHPFIIEGLNIKGEVKKGKETVVSFKAEKTGTYRLICTTHTDITHSGPMIAYINVID